jgi:hypothetical protein
MTDEEILAKLLRYKDSLPTELRELAATLEAELRQDQRVRDGWSKSKAELDADDIAELERMHGPQEGELR